MVVDHSQYYQIYFSSVKGLGIFTRLKMYIHVDWKSIVNLKG